MENVGGVRRVTGGSFPASMWQAFMGPALEPYEPIPFADPPPLPPQVRSKQLLIPGERAEAPPTTAPRRRPTTTTTAGPTSTTQTTATTAAPAATTTTAAPVAAAGTPPPPPAAGDG
jgi:membrane peptidoglycan carboxypeptidase